MNKKEILLIAGGNASWYSPFGRELAISYKANIIFPCHPLIILLGIYPPDLEIYRHKGLQTNVINALFKIAKNWKQLICPSMRNG